MAFPRTRPEESTTLPGIANVVVVYRAMNERSEYRFGPPMHSLPPPSVTDVFA